MLVGTWTDAVWAIRFYERHGFQYIGRAETERLLKMYWIIPERQIETSVVRPIQCGFKRNDALK